jgi:glycosyltransferase involved in cell wall biosynthesis
MISENLNSQVVSQPLVSVIVPVYNVEKYIKKCVRTIMEQDHKNLEIILVDDGTKDSSGQIIDELARQDHRIHVIHKENGGVSSARNSGLDVATGEYIVFVDGDDYVEKEYVSYLVDLAEHTGCDMAVSRNHYSLLNKSQIREDHRYVASAERAIEDIYLMKLNEAVWNKLYRHDFLKEKGIRVYRTFVGEYATSMEMAGASISVCRVADDEMKEWINMPVHTPFYTQV